MIRSFFFSISFYLGIIVICLLFLPCLFLPQKIVLLGGKIMGHWSKICLEFFLSTKIEIKGKQNMKWFRDRIHFRKELGDLVLDTIFNNNEANHNIGTKINIDKL